MIIETELKLLINPKDITLLIDHPFLKKFAAFPPSQEYLKSIYYDLPELDLLKGGYVFRVTETEQGFIQTIKNKGKSNRGLHQRKEWSSQVKSFLPDLTSITDPHVQEEVHSIVLHEDLIPVFETRFQRIYWDVKYDSQTLVELVLDQGAIWVKDRSEPISEVELELKNGEVEKLYLIAEELQKTVPMTLENRSKAERGYHLYRTLWKEENKC